MMQSNFMMFPPSKKWGSEPRRAYMRLKGKLICTLKMSMSIIWGYWALPESFLCSGIAVMWVLVTWVPLVRT